MKVYISGKMGGIPEGRIAKRFEEAASYLRNEGFIPVNPAVMLNNPGLEYDDYIKIDGGVIVGGPLSDSGRIKFTNNLHINIKSRAVELSVNEILVSNMNSSSFKSGLNQDVTVVVDSKGTTKKLTFTKGLLTGVS